MRRKPTSKKRGRNKLENNKIKIKRTYKNENESHFLHFFLLFFVCKFIFFLNFCFLYSHFSLFFYYYYFFCFFFPFQQVTRKWNDENEKDDDTQQTKRGRGVNWFSKQNKIFKTRVTKNFFCMDRIIELFINWTQSILNQSTLFTKSFIRVLSFTKIYLEPFWKLINTWMRDNPVI